MDFDKIHRDIMNIPAVPGADLSHKEGHRDARHKAAEIVTKAASEFASSNSFVPYHALGLPLTIGGSMIGLNEDGRFWLRGSGDETLHDTIQDAITAMEAAKG